MRNRWWVLAGSIVIALIGYAATAAKTASRVPHPQSGLHPLLARGLADLQSALGQLDTAAIGADRAVIQDAFRQSRRRYKLQEALLAASAPSMAGLLNGPLPENDDNPNQPIGAPAAFQRIEAVIFSREPLAMGARAAIRNDVQSMQKTVRAVQELVPHFPLTEANVLEALRTQLARISVLALAGMDSHESGDAVVESADALAGMRAVVARAEGDGAGHELWRALSDTLQLASASLRADSVFATSNRLRFLAVEAAAVGRALARLRVQHKSIDNTLRTVWRSRAATLFEPNAFDASAYAPAIAMEPTQELLALGSRLFHEKRLSGQGTRSCATCHVPELAFTDGLARHPALGTHRGVRARNTPTLLNVALQPAFFADARVATLEEQVRVVLGSAAEMGSSVQLATSRLIGDSSYRAAFRDVILRNSVRSAAANENSQEISEPLLQNVLAAFVRSLARLDSRFDAAVAGDTAALTAAERRGFTIFMGKGRCGTCHFVPLFSGVIPPAFNASEMEVIGVPLRADTVNASIDPDPGRGAIDSLPRHRHAFTVPTLRNIARTAPYMHNGVYATLEQVVDFYNRGGGVGIGAGVPTQTLSSDPLGLSREEQRDLIAFMKSLTDRAFDR